MAVVQDNQIAGIYDDGTESGAVRAAIVRGDLVMMPFRQGFYSAEGGTPTFYTSGWKDNADASSTRMAVSVTGGSGGSGVRVWMPFWGNVFGIRWLRDKDTPPFSVCVDGVAYAIPYRDTRAWAQTQISVTDGHALYIVTEDLGDGPHMAEIVITQGVITRLLYLYGYVVEKRAGYIPQEPRAMQDQIGTLSGVTPSSIAVLSSVTGIMGLRKVWYSNTTNAAVLVTITATSGNIVVWSHSIPAYSAVEFDPGMSLAIDTTWKHVAAATGVQFLVVGTYR